MTKYVCKNAKDCRAKQCRHHEPHEWKTTCEGACVTGKGKVFVPCCGPLEEVKSE